MAYSDKEIRITLDNIYHEISKGASLRKVLKDKDMPHSRTFYKWIEADDEELARYTRAREERQDKIFEDIMEIADDSSQDERVTEGGNVVFNSEFAARSKIKIDARKWMLGKMNPKVYGDKIDITSKDEKIQQTDLSKLSYEELRELTRNDNTGSEKGTGKA